MSRMRGRVLHLIDTGGPGGAETIFLTLVTGLGAHGWESVPVVPEDDWLAQELRERGLTPILLSSGRPFDAPYLLRLRRLVVRTAPDLVQTHLMTTGVYGSVATMGRSVPVVSTFHGLPDVGAPGPGQRVKFRLLARPRNRVVFVSDSLAGSLQARMGLGNGHVRVIHNGIDVDAYAPGPAEPWRTRLGAGPDDVLLGAVGNVRRSKAYEVLLRAFARIRAAAPSARLAIAGQAEGPLFEELVALADALDLGASVRFAGFVDDVPGFLRALDLFVLSSSDEGFSLATTQAMATGLPVVATRCGGPEEIVRDGVDGVLVPPDDPDALAAAALGVLQDPAGARALGEAARRSVAERFSVDAMVRGYAELYAEVLGRG